jgi:hypothetical protein
MNTFFWKKKDFDIKDFENQDKLNLILGKVSIWSNSENNQNFLWSLACECKESVSLCLGLSRKKDIFEGPFMNATVSDNSISDEPELSGPLDGRIPSNHKVQNSEQKRIELSEQSNSHSFVNNVADIFFPFKRKSKDS